MNKFWVAILCVLWLGSGVAQSFPYHVSVETVPGHCYDDAHLIFTLSDNQGNEVLIDPQTHHAVNTAQYPLYNVQYHYQNLSSGLGLQYDYSNDIMLTAGTYSVGVRANFSAPNGALVDTTFNVQITTSYNHLEASAIFELASGTWEGDRERFGYRPSFHCADMGRIQLKITQGLFPYEVTILDEQQDTVNHAVFYQRVNNGNDMGFANYRDYYTFDNLPIGTYTITVSDSCGYVAPMITFTIPDAQPIGYLGLVHTDYPYTDECPNETVIRFEIERWTNPEYNQSWYNYMYPYFDSTFRYRFINPGNDTTAWSKIIPPPSHSSSGAWATAYDTLPNYCVMFYDTIKLQVYEMCHDTIITFSSRYIPQFALLDSVKTIHFSDSTILDTCSVHLQSGISTQAYKICGDTWEDAGKTMVAGRWNIVYSVPFRYFRCPLSYNVWSLPDSTLLGHIESDYYTGLGSWVTFDADTTIPVRVSITDAQGCELAAKDTVFVFQTEPMDDLYFWFECHNDKDDDGRDHCCDARYLWIQEHGVDANTFRRNMTLQLVESPLYNRYNFTATRQDGVWTFTPANPDNHSTYVEFTYEDGWRATVRDSVCLAPGRYTFAVSTDCGDTLITYEWVGYYYDTLAFTSPPQYEMRQVCDRIVVTQVSTGLENYIYYIDPSVSNDEPIQQECNFSHYCYSPSGISSTRDAQRRDVLVFSVPGTYSLTTYSYNNPFSYNSYQSVLGWCSPYVYYYDTITVAFSYIDFDMAAALLCDQSSGTGIVSVQAVNGNAPYTYTLYDQPGASGNVVATSTTGFFDNVPMTEGQQFSVQVTDSCLTSFSVNLTAASLTNSSLLWEQGASAGTPHCAGDTIHFIALNFPSPATFHWTSPNGQTTVTQTNEIHLPFHGESGWYKVEIQNSLCGDIMDSVYVPSTQPPQVTFFGNAVACPGSDVALSFIPQGNGQVSFDVHHLYGHNSFTVNADDTLVHSFPVYSGNVFWVDHISDDYCTRRNPIDSLHVNVYTVSTEVTDFFDTIEDTQLPYHFAGLLFESGGVYEVGLADQHGCDSLVALHLTVHYNQLPPPEVSIATPNDTICVGNSVTLQAVIENAALFTPPPVPRIVPGDILCTDSSIVKPSAFAYSGKTALGIVFYVDSTEEHGWAVDLHDLPGEYHDYNYRWTTDSSLYVDIPTLNNYTSSLQAIADFDGYGNTGILRALDNAAQYPAAMAVDFDHGWYLPAMGQLVQMYAQLVVVNASLTLVGGTPFPLDDRTFYWSSTEVNRYRAWNLVYGGSPRNDHKSDWLYVRSVRSF